MNQQSLKALTLEDTLKLLPNRAPDTHKGQLGHVLIIGGEYGMGGAVRLAGEAALRSGAGKVSLATRREHAFSITGTCSELMCHGIEETSQLIPLLEHATAIVLGPGLGQTAWSQSLFEQSLTTSLPMVMDADALNLLAKKKIKRDNWILTPHPGEAARLLNTSVHDIQQNRNQSIQTLQQHFGGVIILKGANSLVLGSHSLGKPEVCHLGNPGMATAGMGDVLSGILGGLIGQGLSLEQAAKLGVCVHATAGDKVALYAGQRGMKASDLFSMIQICLNPID